MLAKELCNISVSPLVVAPFCTEWSSDNHISIITERGIHVFELIPAPTCPQPAFKFSRSFVNPSEILPTKAFEEEIDSAVWRLDRQELYSFLMEEATTPSLDGGKDIEPRVTSLAWSPARLMDPCRCLLATVSSAGALDILFKVSRSWFSACDLSALWLDEAYGISGGDIRNKLRKVGADKLRHCLRRLQATAITWSDLHECGKRRFAHLVAAYRNSEIVVWRVSGISSASWQLKPSIQFKIVMESKGIIDCLKWIRLDKMILIVVGYFDGRVDGLSFDIFDDKFGDHVLREFWNNCDRIPVNRIEIWDNREFGSLVVICKGPYLIALQPDGENTQFIHVEGFSITGILVASEEELIVSTQNGSLFAVKFDNNELVYVTVEHNLPSSHLQYLGLACSLNKSLFLNITSPDVMHDHLISREPSTMFIFTMEGRREWNPVDRLQNNESKLLTRHWDCLESIRVQVLKYQDSCAMLPPIPDNLDVLSNYELRLAMWSAMVAEAFEKRKFPRRSTSVIGEITDAHPLVFLRLATARLDDFGNGKNLSAEQRLCASLLRSYIEVYLAGEGEEEDEKADDSSFIRVAKNVVRSTSHLSSVEPESCDICGEIITEISWKTTTCPSGHKLPRCAVTLLQVSSINYRSCPICGQILHPSLDEEYEEPLCPYCQVPAIYDSRVLDAKTKFPLPDRNLSKRRIVTLQQSKNNGADKSGEKNDELDLK